MRWVKDIEEARTILREARERASMHERNAEFKRLTFDCVEFHSRRFLEFLRKLMEWSGDASFHYAVLDPDPINYFFTHFHKYPLVEITSSDSGDVYIAALTEDPGQSPADAIGTNWSEYVILPPSNKWFIHTLRDAQSGEGGHLWVPIDWSNRAKEIYP